MNKDELFNQYQSYIIDLVSSISAEGDSQNGIAQEERRTVAAIENEYMQTVAELQQAKQVVTNQYRSVWESCTSNTSLRRPEDQRPSYTDESWRECVRSQERAAKAIQEWFAAKTQEAVAEKQRKIQQEAARKSASALLAAEAERKRKEEADSLEEARGASLLEKMKRKYGRNH